MQRSALKRLLEWKVSGSRKPLIIRGARQVGKTWLMKDFGEREYEHALSWLVDCGLVHKVHKVSKPAIPLKAYEDLKTFKLFFADIGLLGAICDIDVKILLKSIGIFEEFKGVISEQFILQQLISASGLNPFYWSSEKSTAEIDFLLQYQDKLIPIEVKAEENLQAKSLKFFVKKFKPTLAIRTSMSDYRKEDWLVNIPLYAICGLKDFIRNNPQGGVL